jgi:type II secretory pathway pseudopilin PulG
MDMKNERGFTLPELIVVTTALFLALIGTLLLLRPTDFTAETTTAERRLGNARMLQALRAYQADHGSLPDSLPTELTPIATIEDGYDLCSVLVPEYLKDLPYDPGLGYKVKGDDEATTAACNDPEVEYVSGYFIMKNDKNQVTVTVVDAETGHQQKLSQQF